MKPGNYLWKQQSCQGDLHGAFSAAPQTSRVRVIAWSGIPAISRPRGFGLCTLILYYLRGVYTTCYSWWKSPGLFEDVAQGGRTISAMH